jgi:hypothetical protein
LRALGLFDFTQKSNNSIRRSTPGRIGLTKVSIMTRSNRFSRTLRISALTVAIALSAFGVTLAPTRAVAAAAMVKTQAPGFYRMMLGDFEVTVVNDGTTSLDVDKLLAEPPAKTEAALKKSFEASPVETSSNAFLINTGTKLVLIDTGAGTLLGPTLGKLLMNVRAAGYKPEQIDDVFLTHLHPDHVGGLMADGALAFPNATLHADKRAQIGMDGRPSARIFAPSSTQGSRRITRFSNSGMADPSRYSAAS